MSMKKPLEETKSWIFFAKFQKFFMIICYMTAVTIVVVNVILRQIFKINFRGYDELIVIAVLWLYFISGSYATMAKDHITADVFSLIIKKPKTKAVHNTLVSLFEMFLLGYLVYLCIPYITWSIAKRPISPGLKIPLLVSQLAIITGLTFSLFYTVYYFLRDIKNMVKVLKGDI